jgi:hypothetical protein
MNPPPAPPPRVPPLPIAQLLNKLPGNPAPGESAYDSKYNPGEKGGLPMEIVAFSQTMYTVPQATPPKGPPPPMSPQPGWGGAGR